MKTKTERVDDIPLLLAELKKSNLSGLLNEYFPDHGNWEGTDSGKIIVIFLIYVLSNADHRISHVEKWVAQRIHSLRHLTGLPNLSAKDFTDDKLGSLLDRYSDMEKWTKFEFAHNRKLINVYDLNTENNAIRLDAMITQSHREVSGDFQFGYSKQHRSDLPQLKSMVATLDPMAMPLHSMTVSGNTADDELYWPVIAQLIKDLPLTNQLFVGDSKMGSKEIRSKIHGSDHYYLTPLNKIQCSVKQLEIYVKQRPTKLIEITKQTKEGEIKIKAKAFEVIEVLPIGRKKEWRIGYSKLNKNSLC